MSIFISRPGIPWSWFAFIGARHSPSKNAWSETDTFEFVQAFGDTIQTKDIPRFSRPWDGDSWLARAPFARELPEARRSRKTEKRQKKEHEKEMPQRVCGTSSRYDQAKKKKKGAHTITKMVATWRFEMFACLIPVLRFYSFHSTFLSTASVLLRVVQGLYMPNTCISFY